MKFELNRDIDNQLQPTRWHLTDFSSTSGVVGPLNENSFVDISVFPLHGQEESVVVASP